MATAASNSVTSSGRPFWPAAALAIIVATVGDRSATAEDAGERTKLAIEGTRFTINGQPAFLLGMSYYGGLGAAEDDIKLDLADLARHRFNWTRVWATWGAFEHDVSAIDGEGKPRQPYLAKLQWLVGECDRRGIVVDVTLSRGNGVTGPARLQTLEAHRQGVETIALALREHENWYLDLANERNIDDQRFVSMAELAELGKAAKRANPRLLITASHAGELADSDLAEYLSTARVDFVSFHRPRNADSAAQNRQKCERVLAAMSQLGRPLPLHCQEPFRRGFDPAGWEPPAEAFMTDLEGAVEGGAAGWCLHNGDQKDQPEGRPRRSFDLREARLFEQFDDQERAFLEKLRARAQR